MKQEKSIPTILGLLLLLAAIFAGVILSGKASIFKSKAGGNCDPVNLQITNITNNSVNISFTTTAECLASLTINNRTITDFRFIDQKQDISSSKIHYFEPLSLNEDKDYTFSIISGGKNFNSSEYQLRTAQSPNNQAISANIAWGRIYNPDKSPAKEAIIYLNIPGALPLSAITTSSGNWNIPLSASFNESKTNWFNPATNIEETIFVISPNYPATQIVSNTSSNNPAPDIILGQNSFSSPEVIYTPAGDIPPIDNSDKPDQSLDILNPKDNETLSTKTPEFFGTAPLNSKITIKIESPVILNGQTETSSDGSWQWSPPQDLTPGEHTITVTAENEDTGLIETISRKFIVLASESDTNFTASSSASTSTPTPTSIPTLTTPTPTEVLTPTPLITKVESPSTSSGIPEAGSTLPTFVIIISSILLFSGAMFVNNRRV